MTVDDWVFEAIEKSGRTGATLRDIQRFIDEHRYEELAIDTIEAALDALEEDGRIEQHEERWVTSRRTTKEDAMKRLFGAAPEDEEPT